MPRELPAWTKYSHLRAASRPRVTADRGSPNAFVWHGLWVLKAILGGCWSWSLVSSRRSGYRRLLLDQYFTLRDVKESGRLPSPMEGSPMAGDPLEYEHTPGAYG